MRTGDVPGQRPGVPRHNKRQHSHCCALVTQQHQPRCVHLTRTGRSHWARYSSLVTRRVDKAYMHFTFVCGSRCRMARVSALFALACYPIALCSGWVSAARVARPGASVTLAAPAAGEAVADLAGASQASAAPAPWDGNGFGRAGYLEGSAPGYHCQGTCRLFYWLFPSRGDPQRDPTVVSCACVPLPRVSRARGAAMPATAPPAVDCVALRSGWIP